MKVHFEGSPAEIADLVRLLAGAVSARTDEGPSLGDEPDQGASYERLPGLSARWAAAERRAFTQAPEAFSFTGAPIDAHAPHEYRVGERATGQPSPKPPESPHPHPPYPAQSLGEVSTGESARLLAAGREAWSMLLLYWWGRFRQPRPDGLSEMQKAEWDGGLVDNLTASMSGNGPAMMAVLRGQGLTRLVFDTLLPLWTAVPCYGARGWTGDTHQARRWARIMAEHIASVASASHMGPVSAALEKLGDGPGELDSLWRVFRPSAITHPDDRAFYDATVADWKQWAFCVPLSQYNEDETRRLFVEAHPDARPHDVQRVLDSVRVQQMYGSPDPADTINAPWVLIDPKASDYAKGIRPVGPVGGAW